MRLGTFMLLVGCAGPYDEPPTDAVHDLDEVERLTGEPGSVRWGWAIAAGSDLDHDGRAEWVVSAPGDWYYEVPDAVVQVFEDQDLLTERKPGVDRPELHGEFLTAGLDVDGDGYPDLAYATESSAVGSRTVVLRAVEEDQDAEVRQPDGFSTAYQSTGVHFLTTSSGPHLLQSWTNDYVALTPGAALAFGDTQQVQNGRFALEDFRPGSSSYPAVGDVNADGSYDWVFAHSCAAEGCTADEGVFVCPARVELELEYDCEPMQSASLPLVGFDHAAGDLDGDGSDEVVSSRAAPNGEDGVVVVFRPDGTELAVIRGSHGAMFGLNPTFVTDGRGDPWLMVAQVNLSGNDPGSVWAFRGEHVVGDLIEEDADLVFQAEGLGTSRLGNAIATYQPTPDEPVQLLLGSPFENAVYVVDFDAP